MRTIDGDVCISGAGGNVTLRPIPVEHGSIDVLGFRIDDLAYLPDVSDIPAESWSLLDGLDCLVLDALRRAPHPTHVHLERSLEWIAHAGSRRAVLTNMHIDLDYRTVADETPANVTPAHDGMVIAGAR